MTIGQRTADAVVKEFVTGSYRIKELVCAIDAACPSVSDFHDMLCFLVERYGAHAAYYAARCEECDMDLATALLWDYYCDTYDGKAA